MSNDEETNKYASFDELARIQYMKSLYAETYPEPYYQEPEMEKMDFSKFLQEFGMESVMIILSAIGAFVVSAITVATALYLQELVHIDEWIASLASDLGAGNDIAAAMKAVIPVAFFIGAPLAFEGVLVYVGFIEGKNSGKITLSRWAEWTAFLVTCLVGLQRAQPMAANIQWISSYVFDWISIGVVITTGFGAPILIRYGMRNAGILQNQWKALIRKVENEFQEKKKTLLSEYKAAHDEWGNGFATYYEENSVKVFGEEFERRDKAFHISRRQTPSNNTPQPEAKQDAYDPSITENVRKWLIDRSVTPQMIGRGQGYFATPSQIAKDLGLEKSDAVRNALQRLKENWDANNSGNAAP